MMTKNQHYLQIPGTITRRWADKALKVNRVVSCRGQQLFIHKLPPLYKKPEIEKLLHQLGLHNSKTKACVYHGTSFESLLGILKHGLFSSSDSAIFSSELFLAPNSIAGIRESTTGYGIITVWQPPFHLLEHKTENWDKNWTTPTRIYSGSRKDLPIRTLLKDAEELRFIPPVHCVGIFVVDSHTT